nr:hypothetical protein [Tanacetum cinerariifolium]
GVLSEDAGAEEADGPQHHQPADKFAALAAGVRQASHDDHADGPEDIGNRREQADDHRALDARAADQLRSPEIQAIGRHLDEEVDEPEHEKAGHFQRRQQRAAVLVRLMLGNAAGQMGFLGIGEPMRIRDPILEQLEHGETQRDARQAAEQEQPVPAAHVHYAVHRQVIEHARRETGFHGADDETQHVELPFGVDEHHERGRYAPGDHDPGDPAPCPDPVEHDVARHFKQHIADDEQAGAQAIRRVAQAQAPRDLADQCFFSVYNLGEAAVRGQNRNGHCGYSRGTSRRRPIVFVVWPSTQAACSRVRESLMWSKPAAPRLSSRGAGPAAQRRQAARQIEQHRQIDAGLDAHLVAQVHQILGADIARCSRRERASSQPAKGRIEASRAGLIRRQHVAQPQPARVVKMQGQRRRRYTTQHALHQGKDLTRVGHAGGVGQRHAMHAQRQISVDDLQHAVFINAALEGATERSRNGTVQAQRRARSQRRHLGERGQRLLAAHAHVRQVVRLAGRHHQVQLIGARLYRPLRAPQIGDQRDVGHAG